MNILKIKTIKKFKTIIKITKKTPQTTKKLKIINKYFNIIKKLKNILTKIKTTIYLPLLQIHKIYKTKKQQKIKPQIQTLTKKTLQKLHTNTNLQKISHPN